MSTPFVERRAANLLPPEPAPGDALGLRSALEAVLRRGRLVAAVFFSVVAGAFLFAWLTQPVFRADTLLRIDTARRDSLVPALPGSERPLPEALRGSVAAEQSLLTSRELLLPVIAATGADIVWGSAARSGGLPAGGRHGVEVPVLQLPTALQGQPLRLQLQAGRFTLRDPGNRLLAEGAVGATVAFTVDQAPARIAVQAATAGPTLELTVRQREPLDAFEDVVKRLRVLELARDSGVLRLSFEDTSPTRAAALLNTLVQRYLEENVRRKAEEGERSLAFVEAQLPPMKSRLESAERALADYLQQSRALTPNAEIEALLRQRGELERQLVELQVRRDQLAQNLMPEHPELAAVLRQLATVRSAVERLGSSANRLPEQTRELARLQRVVQAETTLYTTMLQHAQQLRLAGGSWLANAVQLDRAVTPAEPLRPRQGAVLSVGAALGLVLSIGAALLARALQPTVDPLRGLQARATPPTLAMIPESAAQQRLMADTLDDTEVDEQSLRELGTHRLLARAAPDDPAVESLRSVFLALVARERTAPAQVVMLTSPAPGTGKAFVAANLAAVMAEAGRRVLLVDADPRNPGLHRLVGLDPQAEGLGDLLADPHAAPRAIHRHPSAGFDVLLHGARSKRRAAVLLSPALEPLMQRLRERYDHVVINAAPALRGQEALSFGRLADLTYLVVRPEQSGVQESRQAVQRMAQAGVKVEGLLFNGVRRNRLNAHLLA